MKKKRKKTEQAPKNVELSWRVGGPQGSGVDTAAVLFARVCAVGGFHIFGRREYYSNIIGRHSYYDVRVAHTPLLCHRASVDLLATFEEESIARHVSSVVANGGVILSEDSLDVPVKAIPFLDDRMKEDLIQYLKKRSLPESTSGLLREAEEHGVRIFPVPYKKLLRTLAEESGVSQGLAQKATNTLAVAVSCALLQYDASFLEDALKKIFARKKKALEMNLTAIRLSYEFVKKEFSAKDLEFTLVPPEKAKERILVSGTQAVALGKIMAGLSFQTYYPISPATDESVFLESHETVPGEPSGPVVVVQTEDEIAAITMATGAALTGARSATATSGPGFSLMAEGMGWAGINEVPLVVTLYQRGSPGTGLPTRSEQGDLQFAIHAGHGEFPRIVLSSGDLTEAFSDAAWAFDLAEQYQMPVIHLLDKALATTTQTLTPFEKSGWKIKRGLLASREDRSDSGTFRRFENTTSGISKRSLLGQEGGMHWLTGAEHTEVGLVTEDPVERERQMEKRARKLETAAEEIPAERKLVVYGDRGARFTVVSWGSNKGAILEALELLDGTAIRFVHLRLLWPFPDEQVKKLLGKAKPLVMVESNFSGQCAQLLRERTGIACDHLVVKYSGRPMSGVELKEVFEQIRSRRKADRKIVLRNPNE